jgi:amidohydrolase
MTDPTVPIDELVAGATDTMVEIRRDLHEHPELGFDEHRTTRVIVDRLESLGLTARPCPTPTGAVYELLGGKPGRTVLLRADIDGLPIQELDHGGVTSHDDGLMHACGHDAHTAAMLGVAEVLSQRAADLAGRYVFVFQPAEESLGGGRAMVDGGVLDGLDASAVIGCHVTSFAPVGLVALRNGVIMSEAHSFKVTASGAGGHGALMGSAGNVLLAIAQLAGELPMVVEGLSHEGTDCACSAGMLQAGTAPNVVPSEASLRGTLRTFTPEQTTDAVARLRARCEELATTFACAVTVELGDSAPAVVNNGTVTDVVRGAAQRAIGASNVLEIPPLTPSDDVSEFLNRIPGCYFFVGAGFHDGSSGAHHSPAFTIDEGCLPVAARVLSSSAIDLAAPNSQRVGP